MSNLTFKDLATLAARTLVQAAILATLAFGAQQYALVTRATLNDAALAGRMIGLVTRAPAVIEGAK